jgi:hypothetical protein
VRQESNRGRVFEFHPRHQSRVPHISLVFREMWDATALALEPQMDTTPSEQTNPPSTAAPSGGPTSAPAYVGRIRRSYAQYPLYAPIARIVRCVSLRPSTDLKQTAPGSCPACTFRREPADFPRSLHVSRSQPCDPTCNSKPSPPRRLSGCDTGPK